MKFVMGSKAHRAHMSEVMKASWAKRRNKVKAREALRNFSEITRNLAPTTPPEAAPVAKRFVAFNYCPNCGEHLKRLYPYDR